MIFPYERCLPRLEKILIISILVVASIYSPLKIPTIIRKDVYGCCWLWECTLNRFIVYMKVFNFLAYLKLFLFLEWLWNFLFLYPQIDLCIDDKFVSKILLNFLGLSGKKKWLTWFVYRLSNLQSILYIYIHIYIIGYWH